MNSFVYFRRFPFDVKTPIGYGVAILVQVAVYAIISEIIFGAIGITIGSCGIMISMCQTIARKFGVLNENYKIDQNAEKMKFEFRNTIHWHGQAKRLCLFS